MIPGWCDQGRIWNEIKIGNNVYMICVVKKNGTFDVSLTNLIDIWVETLTEEKILQKCRNLNPLLNVDAFNCNDIVTNILSNIPQYVTEASIEQIKLRAHVAGGTMKFALNLSRGTPQHFWETITKPLCLSSMEIMRQHKILLDLIKKKDEEIAEYKAEGAELIRKNIETKTFSEDQLKTDVSLPEFVDCTNAFQAMVNFYNTLDLHQSDIKKADETSSNIRRYESVRNVTELGMGIYESNSNAYYSCIDGKNESTRQTEQNVTACNENGSTIESTENTCNDPPMQVKTGTSKTEDSDEDTSTLNEKMTANKIRATNMIYRPIKKQKKSLHDFI